MSLLSGPKWRLRPRRDDGSPPRGGKPVVSTEPASSRENSWEESFAELPATTAEPATPTIYPLPRGQAICLLLLTMAAILYSLYSTRAVAFPIVLSVLIALPLRPLVRLLRKLRVPAPVSATLIVAGLGGILFASSAMLWEPGKKWVSGAPENLRVVEQRLTALKGPIAEMEEVSESVGRLAKDEEERAPLEVEVRQPSLTSTLLNTTGNMLVGATITISLVFLLLAFGDQLLDGIARVLPTRGDRRNLRHMTYDAERSISRFLLTYTAINLGLGLVIGTGMWIIGMPNPVLWGVMAACLNYIPFVGLAVGTGVVFLVGVISFDSLAYALLAPGIYLAANGIEANVITPLLLGKSLRLNVIIIFVSIVLWGWMWGIGGALIAVPLLIVAKVISDHVQSMRVVSDVLAA